jgi:hypothetical protein
MYFCAVAAGLEARHVLCTFWGRHQNAFTAALRLAIFAKKFSCLADGVLAGLRNYAPFCGTSIMSNAVCLPYLHVYIKVCCCVEFLVT